MPAYDREMKRIFTIGHSTHPFDEFVAMLKAHGIEAIADVRRYPRSRKWPWFNDEALKEELPRRGIAYLAFAELGGRRRPRADSVNTAWRSESFRGYADYLQTPEFQQGLQRLEQEARQKVIVIMCAEAVPWRCHRSLIADALVVRGWEVNDVMSRTAAPRHELTKFAKVQGKTLTYPGEQGLLFAKSAPEAAPSSKSDPRRRDVRR
jgi:uncharacterized protein (DUF488 family)